MSKSLKQLEDEIAKMSDPLYSMKEVLNNALEDMKAVALGTKGDQGIPGYTPQKGIDYFTKQEISNILDFVTKKIPSPIKGDKGNIGLTGDSPVKGVDYFTSKDREAMVAEVLKNVKVKDGVSPKVEDIAKEVLKQSKPTDEFVTVKQLTEFLRRGGFRGGGSGTGGGGGGTWGSIIGTLSNQTDLQAALNAKENSVTVGTTAQYYRGDKTFQTLDKTAVGLSNVDNTSDINKPVSTAQAAADTAATNAAKAYADTLVIGLLDDRGNYNASGNVFPSSGGSGTAGAVLKGDLWTISVGGTLGGSVVTPGDVVRALVDTPGQTSSNWAISENNFGYVAENSANKDSTTTLGTSNTLYPTQNAVKVYADTGLATKEGTITATTSADFWSGAKTFINFATTVRGTVLTGLSLATSQVIAATDTVLLSLGYLQAQITALTTTVSNKVASVTAGTNVTITGTATAPIVNATADMVLGTAQTNSGLKTFLDATFGLRNVANTFTSFFTNTNTAARTYTLKDSNGTIAFTSDITGTNSGTNTGDVTLAGTPNYITIVGQVITRALIDLTTHVTGLLPFANIANVATGTVMYRKTVATGPIEAQTLATLKTDLGLTGTNSGDQTITLTGDVTGTGTGSFATTLASVNSNIGSFTNANVTVNAKGLITAASSGTGGGTTINMGSLVYADGSVPAGNTVANTVTETALTSQYTIPAGSLVAGNVIRLRVAGLYSTDVVAPMITAKIKIGSVIVASSGTITAVAAVTNGGYTGFLDLIVTNAGASGVVESQGFVEFATAATTALTVNLKNTAAVTAIDFTAAQIVTITIQWGTASASNTLTMRQMELDINKIVASSGGLITRLVSSIAINTVAGATANTDYVYKATAGLVFTLPTALANTNLYTLKAATTGVSFATTSSQTVDGSTTGTLITNQSLTFLSDGANWILI